MSLAPAVKTTLYALGGISAVLAIAVLVVLIIGARLPYTHSASVTGTIEAPPDKVFAMITDIANGPRWRKGLASVQILPKESGQDHWIETLGHNQTMSFLALATKPPTVNGYALRQVRLDDPNATYGGTWTYKIYPGPTPNLTILQITEDGFIKPWIYRFVMVHVMGPKYNLENYMHDLQAAVRRP
jgi:hypothetical protein